MRNVMARVMGVLLASSMLLLFTLLDRAGVTDREPCRSAWAADPMKLDEGDNAACLCCHMDFDGEEIVDKHLAAKIT